MKKPAQEGSQKVWLAPALILILAIAVRVGYLLAYSDSPGWDWLTVDNWYHHNWALRLANGDLVGGTTYFRAPLYVFCLASLYAVFGPGLLVARVFGLIVGLVSVGLTYSIGKQAISRRVGMIAASLHALYPICIYFEQELLLDPLFTVFFQLAILVLLRWREYPGQRLLFLAGLMFGLAAITRPTALAVVPVAIVFAVLVVRSEGRSMIIWVTTALILVSGLLIPILPVFVRNLVVADDPVFISSQAGVNLYLGNNPEADGVTAAFPEPLGHNWQISQISYLAEKETDQLLRPGEVSAYWTTRAFDWIVDSPIDFLILYGKKLLYQISNREYSNNRNLSRHFDQFILLKYNPLVFGLVLPLALAGIISRWKASPKVRLLVAVTVVYLLMASLFFVNSRFRLPLMPLYLTLAACGITAIVDTLFRKSTSALSTVLVIGVGVLLAFNPLLKTPQGSGAQDCNSEGLWHYSRGELQEAATLFRQAFELDPAFPESEMNLGICYLRRAQADSAHFYFSEEISRHPLRYKGYSNLASLELLEGKPGEALRWADYALEIAPYDLTSNRLAIRAATQLQGDNSGKLNNVVARAVSYTDSSIHVLLEAGLAYSGRGDYDGAERLLQAATVVEPPPIETDDGAFGPDFIHSPRNIAGTRARAWYQLGFLSGRQGQYQLSIQRSTEAIRYDSALTEAYVNLASGYLALSELDRADSVCSRALHLFPGESSVRELRRRLDQVPRF